MCEALECIFADRSRASHWRLKIASPSRSSSLSPRGFNPVRGYSSASLSSISAPMTNRAPSLSRINSAVKEPRPFGSTTLAKVSLCRDCEARG
jgi:hypothetical protein